MLKPFKQFFILAIAVLTFGWLMKKQGKSEAKAEANEKTANILAKQRDNSIINVSDADKLFKQARERS